MNVQEYLESHIATSNQIQKNCNLTARQVLLSIKKLGRSIIKIANGRSPKYALTKQAFDAGDSIHIWEVDNFGKHSCVATLRPLSAGGFIVEKGIAMPSVFLGEQGNGFYSDLPYFLTDMAPKGFLGKKIAENLSNADTRFPFHLSEWSNEHIGRYLLANTESSIGNLKFGNNVNLKFRTHFEQHSRQHYLDIADDIISGETILSSAGGEQQKFTTFCSDINAHVLVKFSPKGDNENAQRWKDILITEHYAAKLLNSSGVVTAAETHIFEQGGRLFLESKRFDRCEQHGRRSMLSLTSIDAEFVGTGDNWLGSAKGLFELNLLSRQDLFNVEYLSIFAQLIYNSDTHLGNISFETHNNGFALLPIYDMCSMAFAPKSNGEILPFVAKEPKINATEGMPLDELRMLAQTFWLQVSNEKMISSGFKYFIEQK